MKQDEKKAAPARDKAKEKIKLTASGVQSLDFNGTIITDQGVMLDPADVDIEAAHANPNLVVEVRDADGGLVMEPDTRRGGGAMKPVRAAGPAKAKK